MRTIFFGTPRIAVPALEALAEISQICGVICQPDRPAGRGLGLRAPPVKQRALELGLEVVQPKRLKRGKFPEWMQSQEADVALVMAYGRILPKALLDAPRRGCINLHASILPKYRGAAPISWAIVGGETETGITLMQMDEGCDTGPILGCVKVPIGPDQTAGELADELAALAGQVVRDLLPAAVGGQLEAIPQNDERATPAPLIRKEDGLVSFAEPAPQVHDRVRGMTPWPGAYTFLGGDQRLKLLETKVGEATGERAAEPGTIVAIDKSGARVACGAGTVLLIRRAQVAGRKALTAQQLSTGRTIAVGLQLGPATNQAISY